MPQKNTIKEYAPHSYYHLYFRGANKQKIFLEATDYHYFLSLLDRYLSSRTAISKTGVVYPNYRTAIELLAYCLMTNHVHMLIYQSDDDQGVRKFMSSLLTSYSKYFNLKYRHTGSVFESRYKAKRIQDDSYLTHISRYIHMNPRHWQTYKHSSLKFVFADMCPEWLSLEHITGSFANLNDYLAFLTEYQKNKDDLQAIKDQLSN